jgi:hypothetical protein
VPGRKELGDQGRSDVPGRAGDEYPHGITSIVWVTLGRRAIKVVDDNNVCSDN